MPRTCEWIDDKRADMIYGPIPSSNMLPSVITEVQNVVDGLYMPRPQKYCNHVHETFYYIKPIALTICVKSMKEVFTRDHYDTEKNESFKQLPSQNWAHSNI